MKAIRIHNYGGPEVLKYEDAPRPQPGKDKVLIRVHATSVNPIDWKVRAGYMKDFIPHPFPLIVGWDVSGVIEKVGPTALRFKKGDEVYSLPDHTRNGTYGEYIVVRESEVALKPNALHHVRAAAVSLATLTAWQALFDTAQLQSEQRVLIHGAAGEVGHFAVQLAKWKGAHVVGTVSAKNHEMLYGLGADELIDCTTQRFEDVTLSIDVVLDTIGGDTQERSWQVLKKGGILVSLVQQPSESKANEHDVRGVRLGARPDGQELAEIETIIDAGKLAPVIYRILPLSEARRAHELSQSGHSHGKIVLRVSNGDGTLENGDVTMKETRPSIIVPRVPGYAELQREMHYALRAQRPEWIEADGKSPTCDYYESLFAQLLVSHRAHARAHYEDLLNITKTERRSALANSGIPAGYAERRNTVFHEEAGLVG